MRAEQAARRRRLRQFGALLLKKQQNLLEAYHATKGDTRISNLDGTEDYIDYAVSSYDRDFMLSLTENQRKQLVLVEEALSRVRANRFGRCLECDQEIPIKRLEVEPWARYCIRCQELDDQGLLEEPTPAAEGDDDEASDDGVATADGDDEEEEVVFKPKAMAKAEHDEELA